jgi:hypothetical protein
MRDMFLGFPRQQVRGYGGILSTLFFRFIEPA